jgi:adenosylcobyric acid synthase
VVSARDFVDGRGRLARAAYDAFDDLSARYDVIVAEGAGSPAEINLRAGDYVNMGLARHARAATIVVGDVDRGGLFAAMYGTVALLEPEDQRLMAGFVVNKFRGDLSLLTPGIAELDRLTGRRTYGVLPWHPDLWLDSEDALDLDGRRARDDPAVLKVAVVRLPRISNFTDVDALGLEPALDVVFTADPRGVSDADLVVVPGTRATLADLAWMRQRGLDRAIEAHAGAGRPVLGVCGGFQLLGRTIVDRDGIEAAPGSEAAGLALLDVHTRFEAAKVLRLPRGSALGAATSGYEIHHGRVSGGDQVEEFLGGARQGSVFGTMWHGSLENDAFRSAFLTEVARLSGRVWEPSGVSFTAARERRLELLADLVEEHLDLESIHTLAVEGAPLDLPVLPPGTQR